VRHVCKKDDDWPSLLDDMAAELERVLDFWTRRQFLPGRGDLD
jgi:hypothetical protein